MFYKLTGIPRHSRSRFKFDVVNRYFYSNETARDDDISGTIIIHIKK